MPIAEPLEIRFWRKVTKTDTCWLWTGSTVGNGYGNVGVGRGTQLTHRVAYRLCVGEIPDGAHVLHKCDVRLCVNPAHLFLGSHQDNMRDMREKGRRFQFVGSKNGRAKLTAEQVAAIREARGRQIDIAAAFGVSQTTVWRLKAGEGWRHTLPDEFRQRIEDERRTA